MSENSDSEADEGFLDGDIVDNIFNQKDSNAHLEMDFESATKYVRYVCEGRLNKVSPRKYVYFFNCRSNSKCIQIFRDSLYFQICMA